MLASVKVRGWFARCRWLGCREAIWGHVWPMPFGSPSPPQTCSHVVLDKALQKAYKEKAAKSGNFPLDVIVKLAENCRHYSRTSKGRGNAHSFLSSSRWDQLSRRKNGILDPSFGPSGRAVLGHCNYPGKGVLMEQTHRSILQPLMNDVFLADFGVSPEDSPCPELSAGPCGVSLGHESPKGCSGRRKTAARNSQGFTAQICVACHQIPPADAA